MEELIEMLHKVSENSKTSLDPQILARNNFSVNQWECLIKLTEELDLNDEGIRILLDEIISGRMLLPCDK